MHTASCGRACGARAGPCGRPGSPCGRKSRGGGRARDCWAEMSASYRPRNYNADRSHRPRLANKKGRLGQATVIWPGRLGQWCAQVKCAAHPFGPNDFAPGHSTSLSYAATFRRRKSAARGRKVVALVKTVAYLGLEARPVEVQCQVAPGLPRFAVVGLADKAVSESRERVQSAL